MAAGSHAEPPVGAPVASPPVPTPAAPSTSQTVGPLAVHLDDPLVVVDVGCREGEAQSWAPYGSKVRLIGFEPDVDECERLEREFDGPAERHFLPFALGAEPGTATLHVTRSAQSSSLYEPSRAVIDVHPQLTAHEEIGRREIPVTTLDAWVGETSEANLPHFLKLDVQGAELDVLRGAERSLRRVRVIQAEVEFAALYEGQPLFGDVDAYLRERGFVLWRLRGLRHLGVRDAGAEVGGIGTSLPAADAERHPSGGRLAWGDAIYVKAEMATPATASWQEALCDACVAAATGLPELTQIALAAALAGAPTHARPGIETTLESVRATGRGFPEPVSELEDAGFDRPADRDAIVERLSADIDWARREVERQRARPGFRAYDAAVRPLERVIARTSAVRRRVTHWTEPRLGVLGQHPPRPLRVPRRQLRLSAPRDAPAIALVTPSYNQGQFIERTIRSVLAQSYPALQYVVQDGGSGDETAAILERYRDRLHACVSEPDSGQAEAINRGFALTDGEIMAWINSDDILLPGALAAVGHHFKRNPSVDVVYGHRALIDEHDRQIGSWVMPRHAGWTLDYADLIPQETMFWRRSAWEKAGGQLNVDYRYALDWDLLLRFRDSGARFERLPLVIGGFRLHSEQKTTRQIDVGLAEIEQIRAQRLDRPISHSEAWKRLRPYLRRHVAAHTLHRIEMRCPPLRAEVDSSF
jgi:FkbM family methyltransferase